jgi:hypothetical protein
MMDGVGELVKATMTDQDMEAFGQALLSAKTNDHDEVTHLYTREAIDTMHRLFVDGRGQDIPGVRGTAWAAYNAATEYVDYFQRVSRGGIGEPSLDGTRLEKAWFGKGHRLKRRAWEILQDYSRHGSYALNHPVL